MIDIQWKGKIGYGDIVSPICYAHNLSHKLQIPVNLTFRWEHNHTHKIHPRDPETLWERAMFIESKCYKGSTRVQIVHKFENPLDIAHTNYDWQVVGQYPLHNYWFPRQANKPTSNIIVVNSTEQNVVSLRDYGKSWKDPAAGYWPSIIKAIVNKGYEVCVVDYRTPVAELLTILQTAKGFVGYHGTAAWPAKFMHVPSILFSEGGKLTSSSFCYAVIKKNALEWPDVIDNLDLYLRRSSEMIVEARDKYKSFTLSKSFLRHLNHD